MCFFGITDFFVGRAWTNCFFHSCLFCHIFLCLCQICIYFKLCNKIFKNLRVLFLICCLFSYIFKNNCYIRTHFFNCIIFSNDQLLYIVFRFTLLHFIDQFFVLIYMLYVIFYSSGGCSIILLPIPGFIPSFLLNISISLLYYLQKDKLK